MQWCGYNDLHVLNQPATLHHISSPKFKMASGPSTAADIRLLLSAKTEFSAYSHASKHDCWSVLSVTTPASKPESRVPMDIVAVIDVSGSMEGEKLDLVKTTLKFVVSQRKCPNNNMLFFVMLRILSVRGLGLISNLLIACVTPIH